MDKLVLKLRLIIVPFLLLSITIVGGYTLLHWLLLIRLKLWSLPEDMVNMWIPMALPWIPILLWLTPRVKLLRKRKGWDLPGLFMFTAGFTIAVSAIIAQFYVETASGTLTKLAGVAQITSTDTRYYSLEHCYIDKANATAHSTFDVSGRYNENFNMHLYMALPMVNEAADTAGNNCIAWYGVKYYKQIHNSLSNDEKEARYKQFAKESEADFAQKDVSKYVYLERIGNTDDHKGYNAAISNSEKYRNNSTIVLLPVNEPFAARNGGKLGWIFKSFAIGAFLCLLIILRPKLDDEAVAAREAGVVKKDNDEGSALHLLIPKGGYFITPIIINLNMLLFIVMVCTGMGFVSFTAADLLSWGGNYRPSTTAGEWWRLVTNIFLHGGVMHLLANMYGLLFVGIFLEPVLGRARYLTAYVVTGIIASVASLWWHEATVSVGASGAIFGLYGVFLALLLTKVFPKEMSKAFLVSTGIFVGYNLLMGLAGGIDNAAHIGGLLSGFVIGLLLQSKLKRKAEENSQIVDEIGADDMDGIEKVL